MILGELGRMGCMSKSIEMNVHSLFFLVVVGGPSQSNLLGQWFTPLVVFGGIAEALPEANLRLPSNSEWLHGP